MAKFTLDIDRRENIPLRFPRLLPILDPDFPPWKERTTTISLSVVGPKKGRTLVTGDYVLRSFEHCCIIERKYHVDELRKNLLTARGHRRFEAECERLRAECSHPVLLFEGAIPDLLRPSLRFPEPWKAADALFDLVQRYNLTLLGLASNSSYQRLRVGEAAARILVRAALKDTKDGAKRT